MIVCDRCGSPAKDKLQKVRAVADLNWPEVHLFNAEHAIDLCLHCTDRLRQLMEAFMTSKEPKAVNK